MNLPPPEKLTICFAHAAYQMAATFAQHMPHIAHFQVWTAADLREQIAPAHVLVTSGFWHNDLLALAPNLRFIQSISAGVNQYPLDTLHQRGIRLASAAGVNSSAVAQHAMAHVLAFARHIHTGRDNQQRRLWRGMISDLAQREDELGGKTMLIVGLGQIGQTLARLAQPFGVRVIATKQRPETISDNTLAVYPPSRLLELLPQADYVVLTCPLTPETERLIDAAALAAMKPSATLINMARGRVVDEGALVWALENGRLAAAGLDCTWDEPLPTNSPLWNMENVIITPHTGGETRRYEERVIAILCENLNRLWRGEEILINQVV